MVEGIIEIFALFIQILSSIVLSIYRKFIPETPTAVTNKIVLITGAAQGIGKELAHQYGNLGATVICVDMNSAKNQQTVKELQQLDIKSFAYTCDLTNRQEVINLAEKVKKEIGIVNILVNNAGIGFFKRFLDHNEQDVHNLFNANVISQIWMLQSFLPDMVQRKGAQVVSVSSMSGLVGSEALTVYSSTKFAVRGLMEAVEKECLRTGWDVSFTTVYPYFVETSLLSVSPKFRFPSILDILSIKEAASSIVLAQRRGVKEATIPTFLHNATAFLKILPDSAQTAIIEYLALVIPTEMESKK